jgi:acyl-CoA dehydrogenase
MSDERNMIAETVERLFEEHLDTTVIEVAESGIWPTALWDEIAANGLDRVLVPAEQGGIGGSWEDAFVIIRAAGRHTAPVPLAETIGAGWLLAQAGLDVPEGPLSLTDDIARVPWAAQAVQILIAAGDGAFTVREPGEMEIIPDRNIGRDPRDGITDPGTATQHTGEVQTIGALVRSCQMAGAIAEVLELCVTYAGERVQFGRPIGKFQAMQQKLALLAGESAAAGIAAQSACRAIDRDEDAMFAIAIAKIRTGEAAGKAAAISHQVFGAIGFTDEHHLHHLTRRLWSWRAEFGGERIWSERLGRAVAEQGADNLWPGLTQGF